MKKVCVTGANGFIGKSVCDILSELGIFVRGTVRSSNIISKNSNYEHVSVGDISGDTNWNEAISGCDCIVHCAGIAHIIKKPNNNYLEFYQKVNVDATSKLAHQASDAGVKRLIFLSSVKVNGDSTDKFIYTQGSKKKFEKVFSYNDIPAPEDDYAASKLEAEKTLLDISVKTGLEIVILRLPLVYGYGVKGNLERLINFMRLGFPLPFGGINNKRSMIGIDNLVNLISLCIDHPNANRKIFLVSDDQDLSTSDLLRHMSSFMDKSVYLFKVPIFFLKFLSCIFGKQEEIKRLISSLQVDTTYTQKILNWKPPMSVYDGIKKMIRGK